MSTFRSSQWRCYIKKLFSKISQYLQESTCFGVFFLISCQSLKKETPTQVPSYEHCKSFKNEWLFLYFRKSKKIFLKNEKMANWKFGKVGNLGKTILSFLISEFSILSLKSTTRIWNSWKKISEISEISEVSEFLSWPVFYNFVLFLFFHKWPDVQDTTSKMILHSEQNWKNEI